MGGPYVWLIATIAFMAALAGAGYKGYNFGAASVRADWDRAIIEARDAADSQRKADQDKARKLASRYEAKIATQALASREIKGQLDVALKARPLPASCVMDDGVFNALNAALGGEGATGAKLPDGSGKTAVAPVKQP